MLRKDKLRMCSVQQKTCYPSETAAIRAALAYSRKRGVALRHYRHGACGSWHLTSRPKVDTNRERANA